MAPLHYKIQSYQTPFFIMATAVVVSRISPSTSSRTSSRSAGGKGEWTLDLWIHIRHVLDQRATSQGPDSLYKWIYHVTGIFIYNYVPSHLWPYVINLLTLFLKNSKNSRLIQNNIPKLSLTSNEVSTPCPPPPTLNFKFLCLYEVLLHCINFL